MFKCLYLYTILTVVLFLSSSSAFSSNMTGKDLTLLYNSKDNKSVQLYILGIVDGIILHSSYDSRDVFCLPDNTSRAGIVENIVTNISKNDDIGMMSAKKSVYASYVFLYECS